MYTVAMHCDSLIIGTLRLLWQYFSKAVCDCLHKSHQTKSFAWIEMFGKHSFISYQLVYVVICRSPSTCTPQLTNMQRQNTNERTKSKKGSSVTPKYCYFCRLKPFWLTSKMLMQSAIDALFREDRINQLHIINTNNLIKVGTNVLQYKKQHLHHQL